MMKTNNTQQPKSQQFYNWLKKRPKPSCQDSVYEEAAVLQGLNTKPVYPENQEILERMNNECIRCG
jgi:hypothetical protein